MFTLDTPNFVGIIALIMTVTALTRRSNEGLLVILGLSVFLWAVHYGLLGSISGAAVHLVAAVSLFVAHWMQATGVVARGVTGAVFSAVGVGCTVYFGSGWADVLAGVGCVVITMSQFLGKGNTMRVGFMCGETAFFGFAFLVASAPGMAVTAGNLMAGVLGLIRRNRAVKLGVALN
jgi:hypothetical protein